MIGEKNYRRDKKLLLLLLLGVSCCTERSARCSCPQQYSSTAPPPCQVAPRTSSLGPRTPALHCWRLPCYNGFCSSDCKGSRPAGHAAQLSDTISQDTISQTYTFNQSFSHNQSVRHNQSHAGSQAQRGAEQWRWCGAGVRPGSSSSSPKYQQQQHSQAATAAAA